MFLELEVVNWPHGISGRTVFRSRNAGVVALGWLSQSETTIRMSDDLPAVLVRLARGS